MTHSRSRTTKAILVGALAASFGVAAFVYFTREIDSRLFGCAKYSEAASSETFRENLYGWARGEFHDVSISWSGLPKGYQLSSGPGDVEVLGVSGLGFFPEVGRNLKVDLRVDSSGFVEWVFVGAQRTRGANRVPETRIRGVS